MTNTLGTLHCTCSTGLISKPLILKLGPLGNPRATDLEPPNAQRTHLGNIVRWLNRCDDDNNGRVNAQLLTLSTHAIRMRLVFRLDSKRQGIPVYTLPFCRPVNIFR